MRFGCRRMSGLQRVCYITFLLLMTSQRYVKSDGWRCVVIGMALFTIVGVFVSRRRNCA